MALELSLFYSPRLAGLLRDLAFARQTYMHKSAPPVPPASLAGTSNLVSPSVRFKLMQPSPQLRQLCTLPQASHSNLARHWIRKTPPLPNISPPRPDCPIRPLSRSTSSTGTARPVSPMARRTICRAGRPGRPTCGRRSARSTGRISL